MNDMEEILKVINFFHHNHIIDENEYHEYIKLFNGTEEDIKLLEKKIVDKYSEYKSLNEVSTSISDSDFNFNVDDGELSSRTGVIPLSDMKNKINEMNDINPVDNNSIIRDNLNEYEEIGESNSFGIQKTIGTYPGTGKHFHFGEDSGFMTFILVIFLAGISMGIIFMIIMNFLAK